MERVLKAMDMDDKEEGVVSWVAVYNISYNTWSACMLHIYI